MANWNTTFFNSSVNCACTLISLPECGSDGITYGSSCLRECEGVSLACFGECPCTTEIICSAIYSPICGKDGKTYGNSCELQVAGVESACNGKCPCDDGVLRIIIIICAVVVLLGLCLIVCWCRYRRKKTLVIGHVRQSSDGREMIVARV